MAKHKKEAEFLQYFYEHPVTTIDFGEFYRKEVSLFPALETLKNQIYENQSHGGAIGRIDVIFRYKGRIYAGEIKYKREEDGTDFWDALKIIGYTTYYKWQTGSTNIFPAILMPANKIKLEHQLIAGMLHVKLFGIKEKGNTFWFIPIGDKPYWKQEKLSE